MQIERKNLVESIFIADALSFGSHWVYDIEKVKEEYSGLITEFTKPMAKFHEGKEAGELSHYGEQAFALLKSISEQDNFSLKQFRDDWINYLENNEMYMDHSMKDSLEKFQSSDTLQGADNNELGGISRSLSIFIKEDVSKSDFLDLINLTHNGEVEAQTAEFIFNVIEDILAGENYKKAIEDNKDVNQFVKDSFDKISSKDQIVENADERGQNCSIEKGLPIVLDVLWNAENLLEALTINIMAAGDTSARAMVIAAVMAAEQGLDALPQNLRDDYQKASKVKELLNQ